MENGKRQEPTRKLDLREAYSSWPTWLIEQREEQAKETGVYDITPISEEAYIN